MINLSVGSTLTLESGAYEPLPSMIDVLTHAAAQHRRWQRRSADHVTPSKGTRSPGQTLLEKNHEAGRRMLGVGPSRAWGRV